mmetsp:Transcript_40465/g.29135  ORF Transcript_40465/g.29135 Transcript_40465/m.29135 type:complete len:159 (-) Transcript_40465:512-988(-)
MGNIECCATDNDQVEKSTFDVANQSFQCNLKNKFTLAKQDHIFSDFENLSKDQQENLMRQAALIDPELTNKLFTKLVTDKLEPKTNKITEMPSENIAKADEMTSEDREKYVRSGNDLIKNGQVAVVLLASGPEAITAMKNGGSSKSIFEKLVIAFLEA